MATYGPPTSNRDDRRRSHAQRRDPESRRIADSPDPATRSVVRHRRPLPIVLAGGSPLPRPRTPALAQPAGALEEVAFDQNLDAQVPLDAEVPRRVGRSRPP